MEGGCGCWSCEQLPSLPPRAGCALGCTHPTPARSPRPAALPPPPCPLPLRPALAAWSASAGWRRCSRRPCGRTWRRCGGRTRRWRRRAPRAPCRTRSRRLRWAPWRACLRWRPPRRPPMNWTRWRRCCRCRCSSRRRRRRVERTGERAPRGGARRTLQRRRLSPGPRQRAGGRTPPPSTLAGRGTIVGDPHGRAAVAVGAGVGGRRPVGVRPTAATTTTRSRSSRTSTSTTTPTRTRSTSCRSSSSSSTLLGGGGMSRTAALAGARRATGSGTGAPLPAQGRAREGALPPQLPPPVGGGPALRPPPRVATTMHAVERTRDVGARRWTARASRAPGWWRRRGALPARSPALPTPTAA